jgi:IS30 family transposase
LSDADVQRVEDKLNSRPRKILGYQTPVIDGLNFT